MIASLGRALCDDRLRGALNTAPKGRAEPEIVLQAWSKIRDDLDINLDYFTSGLASRLESVLSESNVSGECHQGLIYLFDQAKLKETWALKGKDSMITFKLQSRPMNSDRNAVTFNQTFNSILISNCYPFSIGFMGKVSSIGNVLRNFDELRFLRSMPWNRYGQWYL